MFQIYKKRYSLKKLYIIRHAKSSWDDSAIEDFDRVLNERGLKDASLMGEILKGKNVMPDLIISSPALRAIKTAELIAKEVDYKKIITPNQYLYDAYVTSLQETVSYINDTNDVVFLVAHNPAVSALAYMYCNLKENLSTTSVVEIDFYCNSWLDVSKENSKLITYDFPKNHK